MAFITIPELETQIKLRKEEMRPRDLRMDFWHAMYLLVDEFQLSKPNGLVRFTGNEPRTVVDLGANVMARNPFKPRIAMEYIDKDEEREAVGLIEKGLRGAFQDIDRQMTRRGMPTARKTAAFQLLLRGWAANRIQLVDDPRPIDFDPWDMRFVYPLWDRRGLHSVIYESLVTWGDVLESYPAVADQLQQRGESLYQKSLGDWVTMYEFWDRSQSAIAVTSPRKRSRGDSRREAGLIWAVEPAEHGVVDEVDEPTIPIIIVPSHGLPFQHTPSRSLAHPVNGPYDLFPQRGKLQVWKQPGGWVADQGRSILSSVEEAIPEFNELVSVVWQIMDNEAFGTWVSKTRRGEAHEVSIGSGAVNFMRVGEELTKAPQSIASPDTYRLVELLAMQIGQGTVDQKLLRGLEAFTGSGFLRSQMENAAMNALGPWVEAHEMWATENAMSILNQLRHGNGRQWTVWAEGSDRRLFKTEFGPESVQSLGVVYVEMKSKPALPDDLAVRVNIAAQLANPARPLASIQTIFDRVLEWEDAEREKKLIFDDLADTDPVVVMLRLQSRMLARGWPELAQLFGEKAFFQAFVEKATQYQMLQQLMGQGMGAGRPPTAGEPFTGPAAAPPETYGIEPAAAGVPPTPAGGAEGMM